LKAEMSFQEATRDLRRGVIIYTAVPPPQGVAPSALRARLEGLERLVDEANIDAIHIPEVRDERRRPRVTPFVPKLSPRTFGRLITRRRPIELVIDRGTVHTHWANQQRWLYKTRRCYQIRNLVLVGGESSKIRYPGPTVTEAAQRIAHMDGLDFFLGGITIPGRRSAAFGDEPNRLLEKTRSGIEFFISQVIYEASHVQNLLKEYHQRCLGEGVKPQRIFLSFAPISSERDLRFLRWWGVKVPSRVERFILKGKRGIARRSIQMSGEILEEILEFARRQSISVPLGLNIEHVSARNLRISYELAAHLSEIYAQSSPIHRS